MVAGVDAAAAGRARELWRAVFELFTTGDALLEFVPGDDPTLVADEARTLSALLEEARRVRA